VALDFQTALSQYGAVGVFAQQQPEINALLQRAINEEWDSARFERELWNTNWWKSLNESGRQLAVLQATDPASYNSQIQQQVARIDLIARQLGVTQIDEVTLAYHSLLNGWDDTMLRAAVVDRAQIFGTDQGALVGAAGEVESHIRQTYANYGIPISDGTIQYYARNILSGRDTIGGVDNVARAQAAKMYPGFADQINAGQTLRQIADPYIQTMANTLELADTDIKLDDPYIRQALQDANGGVVPLWQFERKLKSDPRWDKTKQAANETYAVLQQIGNDWGFSS
jgi:hypothetical protein